MSDEKLVPSGLSNDCDVSYIPPAPPENGARKFFRDNRKVIYAAIIFTLLIILLITFVWGFRLAITSDSLPEAPVIETDVKAVSTDAAVSLIATSKTTIDTDELNCLLEEFRPVLNGALEEEGIDLVFNDLFGKLEENLLTVYSRTVYKDTPVYLTMSAEIDYMDPYVLIYVSDIKLGAVSVPVKPIMKLIDSDMLPKELTVLGRRLVYDTSGISDKLRDVASQDETMKQALSLIDSAGNIIEKAQDTINLITEYLFNKTFDFGEKKELTLGIDDVYVDKDELVISAKVDF